MSEKLKPCPFCGSKDVFIQNPRIEDIFSSVKNASMVVICPECGVGVGFGMFGVYGKAYDDLSDEDVERINEICANGWNRRVQDDSK